MDEGNKKFEFFGSGTSKLDDIRIELNWIKPLNSFSEVMLNASTQMLRIVNWAYWLGCCNYIEDETYSRRIKK
jgi:hypothetical protein